MTFCLRLRVRYHECDGQGIVFNARWGEYVDVAVGEYARAVLGGVALDWKLVKQTIEWRASARYDDVLDIRVGTIRIGTTSFALETQFARGDTYLARVETVYVVVDPATHMKRAIPDAARIALERGSDLVVDQSGVSSVPRS
jgi:acyl-CoA thioester hydrolase